MKHVVLNERRGVFYRDVRRFFIGCLVVCASGLTAGCVWAQDDFAPKAGALLNEFADASVELAVLPTYPDRAKRNNLNGEVTVRFTVSRYGRPIDPEIISASPKRVFNTATLDALKYWFIRPARADVCETIEQTAEQTFRFVHDADPPVQLAPIVIGGRVTVPRAQKHVEGIDPDSEILGVSQTIDPNGLVVAHRVEPDYPEKAVQRKREGFVTVSFFIEKDGSVTDPKVEASKNGMLFNRAATGAMRQWRFEPALRNGEPIERLGCHEFLFNLDARAVDEQRRKTLERTRLTAF